MTDKPKFPRADALKVAKMMCVSLADHCDRLICAGSLRRRKKFVGDVEIVYIPKLSTQAVDFFTATSISRVDMALNQLLLDGVIAKRKNSRGSEMWGKKNKLAVHVATGIPVDFFAATEANWFNYLVCRTGGAENNRQIATAANAKGWTWNPYDVGFTDERGEIVRVTTEEEVFGFVGLSFKQPWERA